MEATGQMVDFQPVGMFLPERLQVLCEIQGLDKFSNKRYGSLKSG
jgi:hypothetical protein